MRDGAKLRMQVSAAAVMLSAVTLACGSRPAVPAGVGAGTLPPPQTATWSKAGVAFRAQWVWTPAGEGAANVAVTVTPTMAGESLRLRARLPAGVALTGGAAEVTTAQPLAGVPATLVLDIGYPLNVEPLIPVEVLLVVGDGDQSAATIAVHNPASPPGSPPKKPGGETEIGGFPAQIGGEAEPGPPPDRRK